VIHISNNFFHFELFLYYNYIKVLMAVVIVLVLHTKTTDAASLVSRRPTGPSMPFPSAVVVEGTGGTGTGSVAGGKEDSKGSITNPIGH
jgi:hypothetical protein